MAKADLERVRADLARAVGAAQVAVDDDALAEHSHDTWPLSLLRLHQGRLTTRPACVVTPTSTEQVAAVLRYANEARLPVVPFGGGSGVSGGVLPSAETIVVDMRRLDQLLELNETALQACVQAGMFGHRFEEALQARGYTMGHWPQSVSVSTVGGWVATRAAGQFSTRYGSIEDMLLGLEAVLADGRVVRIKATPRRSAGPDLRHLFLGAEGTAGIVTELTLKVFPTPESRKLLAFALPDFDAGLEAIRHVVRAGWRPPVLRLYDAAESGRNFGQWHNDDRCFLLVVSEGPAALAAAEAEACHALVVLDTIEVAAEWDRIHTLYSDVCAAVRTVKSLVVISGHSSHSYPQGTNIYFTFVARPEKPEDAEPTYLACWEKAMQATLRAGGTICHHHGIGRLRTRWMKEEHGEGLALMRAVKHALDPNGILNPGALLPEE
jgi:alkyldihydroxyacetonephosphate synthase